MSQPSSLDCFRKHLNTSQDTFQRDNYPSPNPPLTWRQGGRAGQDPGKWGKEGRTPVRWGAAPPHPHPDHPDRSGSQAGRATPPPPTHAAHAAGRPLRCINWPCTALSNGWLSFFSLSVSVCDSTEMQVVWRWRSVELRLFVPLRSDSAGPAYPPHPPVPSCVHFSDRHFVTAGLGRLRGLLRERDPVVARRCSRSVSTAPEDLSWCRPPDPTWTPHLLVSIPASHGAEILLLMSRSPISYTLSPLSPVSCRTRPSMPGTPQG